MVRQVLGVVLAGGRSSRMGRDKATIEVAGTPMWRWVASALEPVCDGVVIAGRPEGLGGLEGLADPEPERRGPLAGLVAALAHAAGSIVVLVATDQPWVATDTISRLLAAHDRLSTVPVEGGVRQTTCAVYPPELSGIAGEELAIGGSIQSLLDRASFDPVTDWEDWGEDGRSWFSVDTPVDIDTGLRRFGVPA